MQISLRQGRIARQANDLSEKSAVSATREEAVPLSCRRRVSLARVMLCGMTTLVLAAALGGASMARADDAKPKLTVGAFTQPNLNIWAPVVAQETGAYAKYGLDATVKSMLGNNILVSVLSGAIDVGCTGLPIISAITQGQKLMMVIGDGAVQPYTMVARKEIQTIESLKGKPLGTPQVGLASTYAILVAVLEGHGLTKADVTWVELPDSATRARALIAGRISATLLSSDDSLMVKGRPEIHELLDNAGAVVPLRPYLFCTTRKDFAEKNGEALKRFATAMVATHRALDTDKAMYVAMVAKLRGDQFSPEDAAQLYQVAHKTGFWSVNGGFDPAWIEASMKFYIENAGKPDLKAPPLSDYYDDQYVRAALDRLGKIPSASDPADWYKPH
jgi:ABC-type nitrate/sulfonate/bicarbonate transport system substrate-binding protein